MEHSLIIKSLHDGMAECSCGGWSMSFTGPTLKAEMQREHIRHVRGISGQWKCYAKPASLNGQECGHQNEKGIPIYIFGERILCCEKCGCTKIASDDRAKKGR